MPVQKVFVKAVTKSSYQKDGETKTLWKIIVGDKEYACFSDITAYEGKEVELDLWSKGDRNYAKDPAAKQTGGSKWSGKSWGGGGKSAEDLSLTARTMSASYAKDIIAALITKDSIKTSEHSLDAFKAIYQGIYTEITTGWSPAAPPAAEPTKTESPASAGGNGMTAFLEKVRAERRRLGPELFSRVLMDAGYEDENKITEPVPQQKFLDWVAKVKA